MNLDTIRSIDLFRNLDPVQLAHLATILQTQTHPKNTVLFQEGEKAELFYVIARGRVRISREIPGMGEEALAILNEGSYFGEMELIDPSLPRAARAIAHEAVELHVFGYQDFHALLQADSELAMAVLWSFVRTLSQRLRDTNDKVTAMFAMAKFS